MLKDHDDFEYIILDGHQLREHPCREPLLKLVNKAFYEGGQAVFSGKLSRFESLEELLKSVDDYARCCILFQKTPGQTTSDWTDPVATAVLRPYREEIVGLPDIKPQPVDASGNVLTDRKDTDAKPEYRAQPGPFNGSKGDKRDILSIAVWEPVSVAVKRDPSVLRKGLATRCLALLEADLCSRVKEAKLNTLRQDADGAGHARCEGDPLTIRLRATWEINGEYWSRRGFTPVEVRRVPAGVWGAKVPFRLMTMTKRVSCPSDTDDA
ncbi:hypothetical protein MGYG_05468 [Nannizzia gypsea CBS 118893]|uniref:N-acetyltransferase domain-containing protein n=1 Tax=Arthroderma gypseum (strain ATCC MYA-4604 / CBS 118893) TaxID=535722 RepID=E4UW27_ARTGP|nr:hypothetical protein MGYG_05468 [Nannizzia gypsea CBS 118893]EFR02475.1 hypothetical protein MGYG_05468 [Nannizzia gypsea CBS 118893]